MSITDELRKYASGCTPNARERLTSIADRIDEEHESMAEHGWICLPVDANDEYIHLGDRLEHINGEFTVNDMTVSVDGLWKAWDGENGYTVLLAECRHKPTTVEDVLREFAERYLDYEGVPSAGRRGIGDALMDEYAQRLQLREVDE